MHSSSSSQYGKNGFSERLLTLAIETIDFAEHLNKSFGGRHIASQLVRSTTSAGAHWEETCGAESRADYIHKMQIVLKELRETLYWLRLCEKIKSAEASRAQAKRLLQEADELTRIIGKSVVTAKKNKAGL